MKRDFIETRNYIKLVGAFSNLRELDANSPKIGLCYGAHGLGKTSAIQQIAKDDPNVLFFRATQVWTKVNVIKLLAEKLDVTGGTNTERFYAITDDLEDSGKIIIVDEVDTLLQNDKIAIFETFRDIHDLTGTIIFFVGMEDVYSKIKRHKHYHSRISQVIKFEPIKIQEVKELCKLSHIKFTDELAEHLLKEYKTLRYIQVQIDNLENYCDMNSYEEADVEIFNLSKKSKDV